MARARLPPGARLPPLLIRPPHHFHKASLLLLFVAGKCVGQCSDIPCGNTTKTPFALCSGDGTNATSWDGKIAYSIPCSSCPFDCYDSLGQCWDEPTCAALIAVATWLAASLIGILCAIAFFFCFMPLFAICVCGVTVCGFGMAATQRRQQPTSTVTHIGYVAASEDYVQQPGYHHGPVAQGYAYPQGQAQAGAYPPPNGGYPVPPPPPPAYSQSGPYKV